MAYTLMEQEQGPLKIFRKPEPGLVYTMGIDASTGLAEDYSCAQIVSNTIPFEQVACFRAKWPVNEVSKFVDMLGRYYNEALNVCEINYPGNSIQDALLSYYRYPRNYQMETRLDEDMDISCKFGFRTTEGSKWLLINETQMALSTGEIILNDVTTISEFVNFVYQHSKKRAGGADGFNDDTVMAFMLAYHGARMYPFLKPPKPKKQTKPVDADTKKCWRDFRRLMNTPKDRQGAVL